MLKSLLLVAAASTSPVAQNTPLAEALKEYIVAFDLTGLSVDERIRIRAIVEDPTMPHALKVLHLHDALTRADALEHTDMHGIRDAKRH